MANSDNKLIIVYILTGDINSTKLKKLEECFDRKHFKVYKKNIPPSKTLFNSLDDFHKRDIETYRINKLLAYARRKHPSNYAILSKDTSITNLSPKQISSIITNIKNNIKFDICYLSGWLDRCDKYVEIPTKSPTKIFRTMSPHGIQTFMISPHGRDLLLGETLMINRKTFTPIFDNLDSHLNKHIEEGNVYAITTSPKIFFFDTTKSNSVTDLAKSSECRKPEYNGHEIPQTYHFSLFLFTVLFVAIVIIIFHFFFKSPNHKNPKSPYNKTPNHP